MNNAIFLFFYNLTHQSKIFDGIIIFFAVYFPYIVIFLAFIFLLFHHEIFEREKPVKAFIQKWKEIVLVFFSGVFAWFLAFTFKFLFHTDRPFDILPQVLPLFSKTDYAFPSGHATFFMALAFALFFSHKKIGLIFIFFAFLIGISRVFAGVHFPVDILGGFILGFAIAFLLKKV